MTTKKFQSYDPTPFRMAMAKLDLTPTQAAKKCGLSELTFRKIRNGQDVDARNLRKAAAALGLKVKIVIEARAA